MVEKEPGNGTEREKREGEKREAKEKKREGEARKSIGVLVRGEGGGVGRE